MSELDVLTRALAAQANLARQLAVGLAALEVRYRAALDAFAPPNRPFERRRIIADLPNPRELAFVIGALSEGENETALILAILGDELAAKPEAAAGHLIDEAWYYLRVSIDARWQLDDGPPSVPAAILYLAEVLDARIAEMRAARRPAPLADAGHPAAQWRLRELRAAWNGASASHGARVP